MGGNIEKRRRKRVDYIIDTTFINADGAEVPCIIHDISMSGFYIHTKNPQPKQSKVQVKITLQIGNEIQKVSADCIVIRSIRDSENSVNSGMALEIVRIDPDSSITLYNMVKFQSQDIVRTNI